MIRIHTDTFVSKYGRGTWFWNGEDECLQFESREGAIKHVDTDDYMITNGFKFKISIDQLEEITFRSEYVIKREEGLLDVVQTLDLRNLVLFLAPSEFLREDFLEFVNTAAMYDLIKATMLYIDYFLKVMEFILVRRDEVSGEKAQIESGESCELKRILSTRLTQWRLLLARTYSEIILSTGELKRFHHILPLVNISQCIKDRAFHEMFLAYLTQIIWINFHRRSYEIINMEINRLFRSDHFKLTQKDPLQLKPVEVSLLYGKNYKVENYRKQNSPLIQELVNVTKENLPILWIGKRKYRGNDIQILDMEYKYITPGRHLSLIDATLGILGHPIHFYNTLLKLDWPAVRAANFSEMYDPFHLIRQETLPLPKVDAEKLRKKCKTYEPFFTVIRRAQHWTRAEIKKWLKRDKIIDYYKSKGAVTDVWERCLNEVNDTSYKLSVEERIKKFIDIKETRKIK